jgi:hypothetical protein
MPDLSNYCTKTPARAFQSAKPIFIGAAVALSLAHWIGVSDLAIASDPSKFGLGVQGGMVSASDADWHPALGIEGELFSAVALRHLTWGYRRSNYTSYGTQTSACLLASPFGSLKDLNFRAGFAYGRYLIKYEDIDNSDANQNSKRGNISLLMGLSYRKNLGPVYVSLELDSYITPAWVTLLMAHGHQTFGGIGLGVEF